MRLGILKRRDEASVKDGTPTQALFEELMAAHPRIRDRGLESKLISVLNDAYGFEVARGLHEVDADAASDSLEILTAAAELASTVVRRPASDLPDPISKIAKRVRPPSRK